MDIFRVQVGGWAFIRAWAFIRDFTVYHILFLNLRYMYQATSKHVETGGLCLTLSETHEDRLSCDISSPSVLFVHVYWYLSLVVRKPLFGISDPVLTQTGQCSHRR